MLEKSEHQNEVQKLNTKIRELTNAKTKTNETVTELKVKIADLEDQLQALKRQKDEGYTKQ